MKRWLTEHKDWCKHQDHSQVLWDEDSNITSCHDCGAVMEEHEVEEAPSWTPAEK